MQNKKTKQNKNLKMLNIFKKKRKVIGYKVTTVDRKRKIGIAADSLRNFKEKCSDKFNVFTFRLFKSRSIIIFVICFVFLYLFSTLRLTSVAYT